MDRSQLRGWIEDALRRHDRDAAERGEEVANVTVDEIVDAVWGRLPLEVRREVSRAQVQASLTVLTLRRGIAERYDEPDSPDDPPQLTAAEPDPPRPATPGDDLGLPVE